MGPNNSVIKRLWCSSNAFVYFCLISHVITQGFEPESIAVYCVCGGRYWVVFSGLEKPGILLVFAIDSSNYQAGFMV